jgi:DNA repair exonuclease SbcCD nuclease subunit
MRYSFIHAADLHIDSPLVGLSFKDKAVAAPFAQAGRRAVAALVNETIASNAVFLIIAGDIFDGDCSSFARSANCPAGAFRSSWSGAITTPTA